MGKAGLVLALGLIAAAQSAPLAALPLLMEALALGADRLGAAVAAGLLTTLVLAPAAGALADRTRPSRTARGGLAVILAASAVLCAYTAAVLDGMLAAGAAFAVLLGTRILNGVGVAVLHPSAQAWLWAGEAEEDGARLQSWASASQNAGRFIGPVCVAAVANHGAAWTLAMLAGVCTSALLVLGCTRRSAAHAESRGAQVVGGSRRDQRPEDTRPLLAALFALHVLGGGAQFLLGPLLMARLDFSAPEAARWAGWLMALAAAASITGNVFGRRMLGRRRAAAAGAGLATAGSLVLAPFGDLASVAAGIAAAAVGIGSAVPSTIAELMRRSPVRARGRTAGRMAATQAAAYAAAAPACGFLFSADPVLAAALLPVPAAAAWLVLVAAGRVGPAMGVGRAEHREGCGRQSE